MMKKVLLLVLFSVTLAGCVRISIPTTTPIVDGLEKATTEPVTQVPATVAVPVITKTLPPEITWTSAPTIERTRPSITSPTPEIPCNIAAPGTILDITIPDGTLLTAGETFVKTWRLQNAGSCTWTRLYALTFFSGNSLNAMHTATLSQEVDPGEVVDLSVSMQAPQTPGTYQSNWMLSDPESNMFGIGRNGDAPFWVKIEVIPASTATSTTTPTQTTTPEGDNFGEADLVDGDQFDLDEGVLNPDGSGVADFIYQYKGTPPHILSVLNGTQWMVYGEEQPDNEDCSGADLMDNAISFSDVPDGVYVCYRTSEEAFGRLLIGEYEDEALSISFLTWLD